VLFRSTELEPALNFLSAALPEWRIRGKGTGNWNGLARNWVHFGTEKFYLTLNDNAEGENRELKGWTPGLAHIGFEIEDTDSLIARMKSAGFEPSVVANDEPSRRRTYFVDPDGFEYEFVEYLSDDDLERNSYSAKAPYLAERVE